MVKNLPAVWETSLFPELGIFPGEGNGSSFLYSCLENSMDRGVWQVTEYGVTKSWTGLRDWHFHFSSWLTQVFNTEKNCIQILNKSRWDYCCGEYKSQWQQETQFYAPKWGISHSSLLSSALSVSFYKQIVVQSMVCISDLRGSLARALTSGRTISDSSVAVPFPVKKDQWGHPPQRFVWTMEGIKLRKALAEIIVPPKKKMVSVALTHPRHYSRGIRINNQWIGMYDTIYSWFIPNSLSP